MKSLLVTVCLAIAACQPPVFPEPTQRTPSGIGVSGVRLTTAELQSIDDRITATAECLERVAVEPTELKDSTVCPPTGRHVTGRVERVHIEPTCWIDVAGYPRPQRGTVHQGVVRVGRGTSRTATRSKRGSTRGLPLAREVRGHDPL